MRAVKGMIVEKKIGNEVKKIASVLRCEDVNPKTTFQFYGKDYNWELFVKEKKN
jgi:hypothetical protein